MSRKIDKMLSVKITFWLILITAMVICLAFATDIFWLPLPLYKIQLPVYTDDNINMHVVVMNDSSFDIHGLSDLSSKKRTSQNLKLIEKTEFYNPMNYDVTRQEFQAMDAFQNEYETQKLGSPRDGEITANGSVIEEQTFPGFTPKHRTSQEKQNQSIEHNKKITHVAFLKVHKAGSSTMQNIFFRFGVEHDLNILLPKRKNYLRDKRNQMPIEDGKHYDIFAVHTVYSERLFNNLLPVDSVKIGIVREPIERMISAAYYYRDVWHNKYLKRIPRADFIHNLVRHPEKYETQFYSNTRNAMGKDFGFRKYTQPTDVGQIKQYLDELNSQFLLVLTVDKFDESLVLMRRLLHWSISDILYLKINKHEHIPILLNTSDEAKFRTTSLLDFEIYEYFKKVLKRKLASQTTEFWEEVEYFKSLLTKIGHFCSENKTGDRSLEIKRSAFNDNFSITSSECISMGLSELSFIKKLRKRHKEMNHITR